MKNENNGKGRTKRMLSVLTLSFAFSILLVGSVITTTTAYAATPNQIAPGTGVSSSSYMVQLVDNSPATYLKFGNNFYADGMQIYGNKVNFTNTALASATQPVKTFGANVQSGNATLNVIANSAVSYTMSCTVTGVCYAYYYYTDTAPIAVTTVQGSGINTISASAYITNFTTFTNAPTPAVYQNTASKYLEAKITYTNPSTIIFDLANPFIVFDLGGSTYIHTLKLTEVSASNIPQVVDVYFSSDGTNWGSVVKTVSLTQSASTQSIGIADDNSKSGRYIKLVVNTWGSATSWKLSDTSLIVDGLPAAGSQAMTNLETNMWLSLNIVSYGLIIGAIGVFLANRFLGIF